MAARPRPRPDVQETLLDVFTEFTVASYAANFDDNGGKRFDIMPVTRHVGVDEVVDCPGAIQRLAAEARLRGAS